MLRVAASWRNDIYFMYLAEIGVSEYIVNSVNACIRVHFHIYHCVLIILAEPIFYLRKEERGYHRYNKANYGAFIKAEAAGKTNYSRIPKSCRLFSPDRSDLYTLPFRPDG